MKNSLRESFNKIRCEQTHKKQTTTFCIKPSGGATLIDATRRKDFYIQRRARIFQSSKYLSLVSWSEGEIQKTDLLCGAYTFPVLSSTTIPQHPRPCGLAQTGNCSPPWSKHYILLLAVRFWSCHCQYQKRSRKGNQMEFWQVVSPCISLRFCQTKSYVSSNTALFRADLSFL